jgi:ribA/ribD-fused uncharacterized protein
LRTINEFKGEYDFLSNFYPTFVQFESLLYLNSEAAFQSAKERNIEDRLDYLMLTASESKKKGRKASLRSDWELVKDGIMEVIVRDKFTRNNELAEKLVTTGDAELIEGNWWHDNHFGSCSCSRCKYINKKNVLGSILMKVRDELKNRRTIYC